jgi:two-component system chemotaxis sensor kinase CheA
MEKEYIVDEDTGSHLVLLVESIRKRLPILESIRLRELNAISLDIETIKGGAEILSFDHLVVVMEEMAKIVAESLANKINAAQSSIALLEKITAAESMLQHAMSGPSLEALHFTAHSNHHAPASSAAPVTAPRPAKTEPAPAPALAVAPSPAPAAPVPAPAVATLPPAVAPAPDAKKTQDNKTENSAKAEEKENETIRVNVALLSNLMNLVGELVLTKNQLQQASSYTVNDELTRGNQRLGVITAELQSEVMKTRMQPIGNALTKFQRLVRDTAKDLGKSIELNLDGTDTELDRTLVEAVKDPLTHIVRNAMDHGLETPAERKAMGKNETGRIKIQSYQESGQIVIEVSDDGRGLNVERIKTKVIEKNLVSKETLAGLTEREIQNFVFLPGFSTAEAVSNLSGRGVGMDVVKTNIERIGGTIELSSRLGFGTSIKLKIPLTLAIMPALIISTSGQKFAIPQSKLVELLRIDSSDPTASGIEILQGVPVYRLRGTIMPLITFTQILNPDHKYDLDSSSIQNIVVVNSNGILFGLIVESIEDTADIVVKALPEFLRGLKVFSGATILGDGSVTLTVDINGLAEKAGLTSAAQLKAGEVSVVEKAVEIEYLGVDIGAKGNCIFPLCLVSRLEEFEVKDFHWAGEKKFIPYRGSALPLIDVRKTLNIPSTLESNIAANKEKQAVVVVKLGDRDYGLEVDAIVDLVVSSADLDVKMKDRPGIMGALVDTKDVMILLDAFEIISVYLGNLSKLTQAENKMSSVSKSKDKGRLLIVDDGNFFRKHVEAMLTKMGWEVQTANNGALAMKILDNSASDSFVAIISDIEMPTMDGFAFAQNVRRAKGLQNTPLLAMTSSYSDAVIARALECGFDRLLPKDELGKLEDLLQSLIKSRKETAHAA